METKEIEKSVLSEQEMQKLRIEVAKTMLPIYYSAQRDLCERHAKAGYPEKWDTFMQDVVKAAFEIADEFVKQAKGGEQ